MIVSIGRRPYAVSASTPGVGGRRCGRRRTCAGGSDRYWPGSRGRAGPGWLGRHPFGGEFGGVGEAQPLGVDPLVDPRLLGQPGQQLSHVGGVDRPAGQCAEERSVGSDPQRRPGPEPLPHEPHGAGVDPGLPDMHAVLSGSRRPCRGDTPQPRVRRPTWSTPAATSTSAGTSARASSSRRPARYRVTISARLRMPVGAVVEQAPSSARTSSGVRSSGGSLRPLFAGTTKASVGTYKRVEPAPGVLGDPSGEEGCGVRAPAPSDPSGRGVPRRIDYPLRSKLRSKLRSPLPLGASAQKAMATIAHRTFVPGATSAATPRTWRFPVGAIS